MEQLQPLFDSATLITMAVCLLVTAPAFVVMRLYLRAVFRESQRGASIARDAFRAREDHRTSAPLEGGRLEIVVERPKRSDRASLTRSSTFQHAVKAFHRAAFVYLLAGSIHAATSVAFLSALSPPAFASRSTLLAWYAGRFWSWSFFTMIAILLFHGPDRRIRGLIVATYIVALPVLGVVLQVAGAPSISFAALADVEPVLKDQAPMLLQMATAVTGSPVSAESVFFSASSQPILFWGLNEAGLPLLFVLLTFNPLVRGTVGPLFLNVALIVLITVLVINDLWIETALGTSLLIPLKRTFGDFTLAMIWTMSVALSIVVALLAVRWIADRYRRRQLSDQTFLFDALWLSASLVACVNLLSDPRPFQYLFGLVPFALYKSTVRYGLKSSKAASDVLPAAPLLYLRVFGSAHRAERLFDVLAARWRHAGSIQLMSATDVARGRFEPDEFLDFVSGKLATTYISSEADLERRLAALPRRSDPDARYRVNEFFCRSDTWQRTVSTLAGASSLIVMDLRAFTSTNQGCIFELSVLVDEVPLHRVALLIDQTTDEPLLRTTLADLWQRVHPQSPNAGASARIRFVDLGGGYPAAVQHLVQLGDDIVAAA